MNVMLFVDDVNSKSVIHSLCLQVWDYHVLYAGSRKFDVISCLAAGFELLNKHEMLLFYSITSHIDWSDVL